MDKIDSKLLNRQVELMKKRFDVDEENKIVKVDIVYDKADDILVSNLDTRVPTFDREKFGRIKEVISDFPLDYKADLNIRIDDYQGYEAQEIIDGFNDAVELTHYSGNREHKKKWIQITFLLIAGIMLLNILARGVLENWLDLSETNASVFKEVFDITSWVFIWEAVSLSFLTPSDDRLMSLTLAHRLNRVSFLDKNKKVLVSELYRESYENTAKEKKLKTIGKYALLVSGAAFFALAISELVSFVIDVPNFINSLGEIEPDLRGAYIFLNVILLSLTALTIVFEGLGGFAAMSAFTGKVGRLYKMVLPFGIIITIFEIANLASAIFLQTKIVVASIGLLVVLAYILGAIFLIITREKKPSKENK
jgi:hypothetical protein